MCGIVTIHSLSHLERLNMVTLCSVAGHYGIEFNEKADAVANKSAALELVGSQPYCEVGKIESTTSLQGEIRVKKGFG